MRFAKTLGDLDRRYDQGALESGCRSFESLSPPLPDMSETPASMEVSSTTGHLTDSSQMKTGGNLSGPLSGPKSTSQWPIAGRILFYDRFLPHDDRKGIEDNSLARQEQKKKSRTTSDVDVTAGKCQHV